MDCPCGSHKPYAECCGMAHKDISSATTAEQLMRSRYSAFVLGKGNYLMDSHHSATRPIKQKKAIEAWAKSVSWIRLEVLDREKGEINDQIGTVTFNAYFFENSKLDVLHEKSEFIKEIGLWMYLGLAK